MRRFTLHLIVAFLAFVVGVTAATLLGGLFGHGKTHRSRGHHIYVEKKIQHAEPPARQYDCPYSRGMSELPVPPSSEWDAAIEEPMPPPPPPTATSPSKEVRIRVRRADGTWEVVEPGNVRVEKH